MFSSVNEPTTRLLRQLTGFYLVLLLGTSVRIVRDVYTNKPTRYFRNLIDIDLHESSAAGACDDNMVRSLPHIRQYSFRPTVVHVPDTVSSTHFLPIPMSRVLVSN